MYNGLGCLNISLPAILWAHAFPRKHLQNLIYKIGVVPYKHEQYILSQFFFKSTHTPRLERNKPKN